MSVARRNLIYWFTLVQSAAEFSQAVGIKVDRKRGPVLTLLHLCLPTRHLQPLGRLKYRYSDLVLADITR
jgi:hypothetical protein